MTVEQLVEFTNIFLYRLFGSRRGIDAAAHQGQLVFRIRRKR